MGIHSSHAVPRKNSPRKRTINDSIGNLDDDQDGQSIASRTYVQLAQVNSIVRCWPIDGHPIVVEAGAVARVLGDEVEIVAAEAMPDDFKFPAITACASVPGQYRLCLSSSEEIIGDYLLDAISAVPGEPPGLTAIGSGIPISCPKIAAESPVSAQAGSEAGGGSLLVRFAWFPYITVEG